MTAAASRAAAADQRFYGVIEALVVGVEDPDGEGRVTVSLPWFQGDEVTDWCRTVNLFAGGGYGSTWTPEPGDEVLVAFVHGDMRLPVVLGGLFSTVDKPPAARTKQTNRKLLRTKLGHELTLDDSPGSPGVEVLTSGGHRIRLDDTRNEITVTVADGPSITMSQDGGSIQLRATSITLDAQTITLTARQALTAQGKPIRLN